MHNKKKGFLILNILIPLLIGFFTYYYFFPNVFFVKKIDTILNINHYFHSTNSDFLIVKFIRNYMLDMIWGYALVFSLSLIIDNNTADLLKIFIIASLFSAIMEILQLTPIVEGTFDILDIFVEFFAEVSAVFIIKTFSWGGKKYEKEN